MKPDNYVKNEIGLAALYEQLAEECMELGKEALKYARILRGENPTPKRAIEVEADIDEEFNDVILVASLLKLEAREDILNFKLKRWEDRIEKAKKKKEN